jgi:photosystem II stability/assembly factor-like uncharacterized protein
MKKNIIIQLFLIQLCFSLTVHAQWIVVDSLNSSVNKISTSGSKLYVCSVTTGVYISTDSGYSFNSSNNGITNLNTRIILAKDSLLVLGTNQSIYKSIDFGTSWQLASNGFPANMGSNVEDIKFKGDSILVAAYGNGIFCSTDYCQTWVTLNNGFTDLYRSCIFVNGNRLFAGSKAGGSGIYISDNNGANWIQKNNGVPRMWTDPTKYVDITSFTKIGLTIFASTFGGNTLLSDDNGENWSILSNPNNYQWTIFGTGWTLLTGHNGTGVCRSDDLGINWTIENEGLITLDDKDIQTFCMFGGYIYAGGRPGVIFKRPVSQLITGNKEKNYKTNVLVYPNPVSDPSKIIIPSSLSEKYTLEIYNNEGICIKILSGLEATQLEVRKSEFLNGIFFFRITGSDKGSYVGKFIVN